MSSSVSEIRKDSMNYIIMYLLISYIGFTYMEAQLPRQSNE